MTRCDKLLAIRAHSLACSYLTPLFWRRRRLAKAKFMEHRYFSFSKISWGLACQSQRRTCLWFIISCAKLRQIFMLLLLFKVGNYIQRLVTGEVFHYLVPDLLSPVLYTSPYPEISNPIQSTLAPRCYIHLSWHLLNLWMATHTAIWRTTVREAGRQTTSKKMRVKRWRAKSSGNSWIRNGGKSCLMREKTSLF